MEQGAGVGVLVTTCGLAVGPVHVGGPIKPSVLQNPAHGREKRLTACGELELVPSCKRSRGRTTRVTALLGVFGAVLGTLS